MPNASKPLATLSYSRAGSPGRTQVDEEYMTELRGRQWRRKVTEMLDTSTVAGVAMCIRNLFVTNDPCVDAALGVSDPDTADELAKWAYDAIKNGETEWSELVTMLTDALWHGWSYIDVSRGRRTDGTIGLGECVQVHPDTLQDWDTDEKGRVVGIWQYPPSGGASQIRIPIDRALHYVPIPHKGSPEGRSILRPIYSDWFYVKRLKEFRAILAERMSGFPVVTAPEEIKAAANDETLTDAQRAYYASLVSQIEDIAPNIKINKQAGATLWTSPYKNINADGTTSYTSTMQLGIELKIPASASTVDYDRAIQYHDMSIARGMLMQFLFMGDSGTSGAQNGLQDMNSMFYKAMQALVDSMYSMLQRQLLPKLWAWNGFDPQYMPTLRAGKLSTETLAQIGAYVQNLTNSGFVMNDPETEEELRRRADLPIPQRLGESL